MTINTKKITDKELIQAVFDANRPYSDVHFGFFLGAGTSVESGIPAAETLCKTWLADIKKNNPEVATQWGDKTSLAEYYSDIFAARFKSNPSIGEEALQDYINKADPSIGYLFLAQILTETKHKIVMTTNFDTMSEDALLSLQNNKPLVISHESATRFSQTNNLTRPVIVKVNRGFLLNLENYNDEIESEEDGFKKMLDTILKETHLIVLGYEGNDEGMLTYLENNTARKAIYWCCQSETELSQKVKDTLKDEDFIVEINSFDRFMLALHDTFDFEQLINQGDISESQLMKNEEEQVKKYQLQLENLNKEELSEDEQEAVTKQMPDWQSYQIEVDKATGVEDRNKLYLYGLEQHAHSPELNSKYAVFLSDIRKDYDRAETYYKEALELEPNDAEFNGNYALFLSNIRKKYDKAEVYYKKALELEPSHANCNGNYALFLSEIRKENDKAEVYYKKALELAPNDAEFNGNYALFLKNIRGEDDKAETYYKKALELEPNHANFNGNYAIFLNDIRQEYDRAESYYKKSLELEPNHASFNGNYALFLKNTRKDYDKAETYYKRALELEPNHANFNGNYAIFLSEISKDYDKAETYFKTALELEPNNANFNGNYALFLKNVRKDDEKAASYRVTKQP